MIIHFGLLTIIPTSWQHYFMNITFYLGAILLGLSINAVGASDPLVLPGQDAETISATLGGAPVTLPDIVPPSEGQDAGAPKPAATKPVSSTEQEDYGFRSGTFAGSADFAAMHLSSISGINPGLEGGAEVGLHKYVGIWGTGGWSRLNRSASLCNIGACAAAVVHADYYHAGGGVEVVGSNHTRFVPYGRIGMAYWHASGSAAIGATNGNLLLLAAGWGTSSSPAILFGGGVKVYITHHFGIDGGVMAARTVGNNGGLTVVAPMGGIFFQSK
jgi:hypothetical protein